MSKTLCSGGHENDTTQQVNIFNSSDKIKNIGRQWIHYLKIMTIEKIPSLPGFISHEKEETDKIETATTTLSKNVVNK